MPEEKDLRGLNSRSEFVSVWVSDLLCRVGAALCGCPVPALSLSKGQAGGPACTRRRAVFSGEGSGHGDEV